MIDPQGFLSPLEQAVRDVELHVASAGWDQPTRLFVLVPTDQLVAENPQLADDKNFTDNPPGHLTAIEQEQLPPHNSLEELLGSIGFSDAIDGLAIATERIMVPPEAEADLPKQHSEALDTLMAHPKREDIRLVAAVLRDDSRSCAIRSKSHDHADSVATGPDLVPGLTTALAETLAYSEDDDPAPSGQ